MTDQRINGKTLNKIWEVGAEHALYREDGSWYHHLKRFPGALFDANGYVLFETVEDYQACPYLQLKKDLHVPLGIKAIPSYVKITQEYSIQRFSKQIKDKSKTYKVIDSPKATDFIEPNSPERVLSITNRIIRDTRIAKWVKYVHDYKCQICGEALKLKNGKLYAEAHHLWPLGSPHDGPDIIENVICVCPNHHALLDFGAIELNKSDLNLIEGHIIGDEYINYHNSVVVKNQNDTSI